MQISRIRNIKIWKIKIKKMGTKLNKHVSTERFYWSHNRTPRGKEYGFWLFTDENKNEYWYQGDYKTAKQEARINLPGNRIQIEP